MRSGSVGARESIAGYEYQFIWSARRALEILRPDSDLCQVVIEGLHEEDEIDLGDGPEKFFGIDLSEYYGGDTVAKAKRIVVSQLKYAVHHPNRPWTAARLCNPKRRGTLSSVIGRMAEVFSAFFDRLGPSDALGKVSLRLVTSRPLAARTRRALEQAQERLGGLNLAPGKLRFGHVLGAEMGKNEIDDLQRVREAAKLRSNAFAVFLLCLDLRYFEAESFEWQRCRLYQEVTAFDAQSPAASMKRLLNLIRECALPGARPPITAGEVYAALETTPGEFLPAPCLIERPEVCISTRDHKELVKLLRRVKGGKVLVHGDAGTGKSVTLVTLEELLPHGSVNVVYDCYGGGEAATPNRQRYPEEVALTQITNEIALKTGVNCYSFRDQGDRHARWQRLEEVIRRAAARLKELDGLLVLAIDAADNAMVARKEDKGFRSAVFLPDIWKLRLPQNARLILSCRSHRRHMLECPDGVEEFRTAGFSERDSAAHLRSRLAKASDAACRRFHEATGGVPRLQYYWLEQLKGKNEEEALGDIVERTAFGIEEEYAEWLASAASALPEGVSREQAVALLMGQARPVNVPVYAKALGMSASDAHNFLTGLLPGLTFDNEGQALFRDEDLETYLRDNVSVSARLEAHQTLSEYCLEHIDDGAYGTFEAARHLLEAKRYDQLIGITLDRAGLDAIKDAISRTRCRLARHGLALRAALETENRLAAVELLVGTARAKASRTAHLHAFGAYPHVGIQLGHCQSVLEAYAASRRMRYPTAYHFELSAELARFPAFQERAQKELADGLSLLRAEVASADSEDRRLQVELGDVASLAEARLWLWGPREAYRETRSWRPPAFRLAVVRELFASVRSKLGKEAKSRLYANWPRAALVRAAALAGLFRPGIRWDRREVVAALRKVVKLARRRPEAAELRGSWLLPFLELCAASRAPKDRICFLLGSAPRTRERYPSRVYGVSGWNEHWHEAVRTAAFRAAMTGHELDASELVPSPEPSREGTKTSSQKDHTARERKALVSQVQSLLPIYGLRADSLVNHRRVATVARGIRELLKSRTAARIRQRADELHNVFVERAVEAIMFATGADAELIGELADSAESILGHSPIELWLSMAEALAEDTRYHEATQRILSQCRTRLEREVLKASDKVDIFMRCASISLLFDRELAADFCDQALHAAEGLDDDAAWFLRAAIEATGGVDWESEQGARPRLARELADAAEVCHSLLSETGEMPWAGVVQTISHLDCRVAYERLLDWHNQGHLRIGDVAEDMVMGLFKGKEIDPGFILPVLELGDLSRDSTGLGVPLLERLWQEGSAANREAALFFFDRLARRVSRDLPYDVRREAAGRLLEWAEKYDVRRESVSELRGAREFSASVAPQERTDSLSYVSRAKAARRKLRALRRRSRRSPDRLIAALPDVMVDPDIYLESSSIVSLLKDTGGRLGRKGKLALLDKLALWPESLYASRDVIAKVLIELLDEWSSHRRVREWAADGITRFLSHGLFEFLRWYGEPASAALDRLVRHRVLGGIWAGKVFLPALLTQLERMEVSEVYKALTVLARDLTARGTVEFLHWGIHEQFPQIRCRFDEAERSPEEPQCSVAKALYGLFVQPDNRLRWRAFYAARQMLMGRAEPLVSHLVDLSFSESGEFWMSAREWLLFLFLHLSCAKPEILFGHAGKIAVHALNDGFPHAGIQELSKRTALRLEELRPGLLPGTELSRLGLVNEPRSCLVDRDRWSAGFGGKGKREWDKWRFCFDQFDTFPYWYSPLAHCFAQHRCDVAERAEKWICDKWGRTSEDCRQWRFRARRDESWQLFTNDHGSHPVIEDLQTYLERHAMHMAAGEMIRELPVLVAEHDYGGWQDWLDRHHFNADPWITSDLRGAAPLSDEFYGGFPALQQWIEPRGEEFEREVFSPPSWVVVASHIDASGDDRGSDMDVSSALVTSETASALKRALDSADPRWYGLPVWRISHRQNIDELKLWAQQAQQSDYLPDFRIATPGFELLPWLVHVYSERQMHRMDSHWPGLSRSWHIPGNDFVLFHQLKREPGSLEYRDGDRTFVAAARIWDDTVLGRADGIPSSQGHRLLVRKEELIEFLRHVGMDLIVNVWIRRWEKDANGNIKGELGGGQVKNFLIRQDGSIEGLAGRSRARSAAI